MTTIAHVPQSDHQIHAAVLAEMAWMPSLHADRIGVAITEGAITLSGQVLTYPEKHAAVRAAFRVRGVVAVADEIEVHNSWAPRNDTDIAAEAVAVLETSPMAPIGAVKAEVHDRTVTLTGSVSWEYERVALGKAIASITGVHGIVNAITLKPAVHVSAEVARTKIKEALRRNAGVEAESIKIAVSGDTITLSGAVDTWAERVQVAHAAWATPGVTHVVNDVYVRR